MTPFPWGEAMRLGLGVLRLPPEAFWKMSPRELAAASAGLTGPSGEAAIGRERLEALRKRYPDLPAHQEHKHV